MEETFKEYKERILNYLGNRDPIQVQEETPSKLEKLVKNIPQQILNIEIQYDEI